MWWRIWNARLRWKMVPVFSGGLIAASLLAYLIPSEVARGGWLILVCFLGLGLMTKMGENETRHRVARLPPGSQLPWWTLRPSLDFPWWASWLLVSGVLLGTLLTAEFASGSWAFGVYVVGLAAVIVIRRIVVRHRKARRSRHTPMAG